VKCVFGECRTNCLAELLGVARLKEALEANDWDGADDAEGGADLDDFEAGDEEGDYEGSIGFGIDPAEMEEEMAGMKQAIYGGGGSTGADDEIEDEETGDREIQQLQAMMLKMQAVKGRLLRRGLRRYSDADNSRYGSGSARGRTKEIGGKDCQRYNENFITLRISPYRLNEHGMYVCHLCP
jgi:hypothetical protein